MSYFHFKVAQLWSISAIYDPSEEKRPWNHPIWVRFGASLRAMAWWVPQFMEGKEEDPSRSMDDNWR